MGFALSQNVCMIAKALIIVSASNCLHATIKSVLYINKALIQSSHLNQIKIECTEDKVRKI